MVVLTPPPVLENLAEINACKPKPPSNTTFNGIPVIDMLQPDAKNLIVKACQEFGFFKLVNHGVPIGYMTRLEAQAVKFFNLPQPEKDKSGTADPFGYGNKRIGRNGDVGWVEYLLFSMNQDIISHKPVNIYSQNSELFWSSLNDYVGAVKNMTCEVLEMIADGLKIAPRNVLSRLVKDERSDCMLRLNHYPPCPKLQGLNNNNGGRNLVGFGEHTDPQIISVLRSNNISGLQIALRDGTWVAVPPDPYSFFINVGDSLQVMTNGRFRSVKHRVVAGGMKSRVSMIYFGGPGFNEKIAPLPSLMEEGEESLYKEFTWSEYKKSAYKTRLGDNRLTPFEKK